MKRAADLCTGLRILLAPLLAWQLGLPRDQGAAAAFWTFVIAAATDYADGALARASGTASRQGRVFDHVADALLLFPAFLVLAGEGRIPIVLPLAAMASFGLYVLDGWRRGGSLGTIDLGGSRSGAIGGVLNYVIAAAAVAAGVLDARELDQAIYAAAFAVAAVNAASAFERAPLLLMPARGSRAEEKEARAPRSSP
jgi:phosphatidylglycerophosphate synthase